jgi:hypothetical protein
VASQLFALEFGACPAGTIPLRSYNSSNGGASSSSSSSHSRNTSSDPVQEHVRKPEFGNSGLQPAEPTASNNLFHALKRAQDLQNSKAQKLQIDGL